MGARPPVRDQPRLMRDREPFRHDRGNRDRYDRRDYHRDKEFRERKPSPLHHAHDFKVHPEPHPIYSRIPSERGHT